MTKIKLINNHRLKRTMITCPACTGDGTLEFERARPQNFNRDIGEIDIISSTCYACNGSGSIDMDDCEELDIDE